MVRAFYYILLFLSGVIYGADISIMERFIEQSNLVQLKQKLQKNQSWAQGEDNYKNTPLFYVIRHKKKDPNFETFFRELVKNSEIDHKNYFDFTPLLEASRVGCELAISILINMGADLESQNKFGQTVLHLAKDEKMKKLLLKFGANQDISNMFGVLPD